MITIQTAQPLVWIVDIQMDTLQLSAEALDAVQVNLNRLLYVTALKMQDAQDLEKVGKLTTHQPACQMRH